MYYFSYEGEEYRVRFRHELDYEANIRNEYGKWRSVKGRTIALVEHKIAEKEWQLLHEGFAMRSVEDKNFIRSIGRQKALVRAAIGMPKDMKRAMFSVIYT